MAYHSLTRTLAVMAAVGGPAIQVVPAFAQPASSPPQQQQPAPGAMPGMDHSRMQGMDHSRMGAGGGHPMTQQNMPGMQQGGGGMQPPAPQHPGGSVQAPRN